MTPDLRRCIRALHHSAPRLVYTCAGAGSYALAWLHAVAGSSRTVLAGWDAYAPRALARCLAGSAAAGAGQAVRLEVAVAAAQWSLREAQQLAEGDWPLLGVAVTAALRTDRRRLGADRAYVALADGQQVRVRRLELQRGGRSRLQQELLVSRLVIAEIALACAVAPPDLPLSGDDRLADAQLLPG